MSCIGVLRTIAYGWWIFNQPEQQERRTMPYPYRTIPYRRWHTSVYGYSSSCRSNSSSSLACCTLRRPRALAGNRLAIQHSILELFKHQACGQHSRCKRRTGAATTASVSCSTPSSTDPCICSSRRASLSRGLEIRGFLLRLEMPGFGLDGSGVG